MVMALSRVLGHRSILETLWDMADVVDITSLLVSAKVLESHFPKAEEIAKVWVARLFEQEVTQALPLGIRCWREMALVIKLPLQTGPSAFANGQWTSLPLQDLLLATPPPAFIELLPGMHYLEAGMPTIVTGAKGLRLRGVCSGVRIAARSFAVRGTLKISSLTMEQTAKLERSALLSVVGPQLDIKKCVLTGLWWKDRNIGPHFLGDGVIADVHDLQVQQTRFQNFKICLHSRPDSLLTHVRGNSFECYAELLSNWPPPLALHDFKLLNQLQLRLTLEPTTNREQQSSFDDAYLGDAFTTAGISNMFRSDDAAASLVQQSRQRKLASIHAVRTPLQDQLFTAYSKSIVLTGTYAGSLSLQYPIPVIVTMIMMRLRSHEIDINEDGDTENLHRRDDHGKVDVSEDCDEEEVDVNAGYDEAAGPLRHEPEGNATVMKVDHPPEELDPVSQIPPAEAEEIANERWASWVQHRASNPDPLPSTSEQVEERSPVIKLTFSRHSQLLEQAILQSAPAQAAAELGMELKPAWAGGAKILTSDVSVNDFDEELGPYHVVLNERDEVALEEALRSLPYRYRKPKQGMARTCIPDQLSLFTASSSSRGCSGTCDQELLRNSVSGSSASSGSSFELSGLPEIVIEKTFIHVRLPRPTTRSVQSW